jgi:hypothetical protein
MIGRLTHLLAFMLAPSSSIPGYAKCAGPVIRIEAEVRGQVKAEQRVMAHVDPDNEWSLLAGGSPNHFVIEVSFSTYSGHGFFTGDRCNRKLRTITVLLQDGSQTLDSIKLKFPDDFVADREGYFGARERVVLDADHVSR